MTDVIGWAITAWAAVGEWLLAPALLAAAWALYRLAIRRHRRDSARRAEQAARPGTDPLEQLYQQPAIKTARRNTNTRKEEL